MNKLFVLLFSSIFVFSMLFANGAAQAKDTKPPTLSVYKVSNKTTTVGGRTEAKATVEVKIGSRLLGKTTADSKGKYNVRIKAQKAGTKLTVIARDKAQNARTLTVTIVDKIAPKTLTVNKVSDKTTTVTGKTEAKASVEVKFGSKLLGKATADSKGNYKVKFKAQKKGTKLTVIAKDKAGNAKKVTVTVYQDPRQFEVILKDIENLGVHIDKEWDLKFSDEIDQGSLYGNIYIVRERDNKRIDIIYPLVDWNDKKSVRLYLVKPYDFNEIYYLHISENVKSIKGTPLKEPINMKFQTVNPEFNVNKTIEKDGVKFEVMLSTKDVQMNKKLYIKVKATNVSEDNIPYIGFNGCDIGLHAGIYTESDAGQVKIGSGWVNRVMNCSASIENHLLKQGETIEVTEVLYPPTIGLYDHVYVKVTFQKGRDASHPLEPIEVLIDIKE